MSWWNECDQAELFVLRRGVSLVTLQCQAIAGGRHFAHPMAVTSSGTEYEFWSIEKEHGQLVVFATNEIRISFNMMTPFIGNLVNHYMSTDASHVILNHRTQKTARLKPQLLIPCSMLNGHCSSRENRHSVPSANINICQVAWRL